MLLFAENKLFFVETFEQNPPKNVYLNDSQRPTCQNSDGCNFFEHIFMFLQYFISDFWTLQQLLRALAVVSTLLGLIWLLLTLFNEEAETMPLKAPRWRLGPFSVLLFFIVFSWLGLLVSYWRHEPEYILVAGFGGGVLGAGLRFMILRNQRSSWARRVCSSTGQVLESIPPHRHGAGKVHIELSRMPIELDAVTTAGAVLPEGAPVRVVGVIDDHTLLVEPLDKPRTSASGSQPHL